MITLRKAQDRGRGDFGWLDSRHSFSFGHYHDPDHMGFGALRVINDDRVAAGGGFDTHGHKDMEISLTFLKALLATAILLGSGSCDPARRCARAHVRRQRHTPFRVQCLRAGPGASPSGLDHPGEAGLVAVLCRKTFSG